MHRVVFGLAFVAAFLSAASLPEDYSLFFDPISSSGSHDNFDASGYFDYDDSAHLDTSMGNDDPDLNLYAKDDCASILGSGPSSRMRRRTDQCISSDSAPQLQIPTLDRSPTGESVLESLENYEVCPMMVFGNRNIPICESGSISDRKFDFGTSGYTLEHCVLCRLISFKVIATLD